MLMRGGAARSSGCSRGVRTGSAARRRARADAPAVPHRTARQLPEDTLGTRCLGRSLSANGNPAGCSGDLQGLRQVKDEGCQDEDWHPYCRILDKLNKSNELVSTYFSHLL